ncbi:MAG: lipoyl(octanoyl) transferase LipB [Solirubrobacterales bacterium]|nr:lipoyl(octanoyl) transferase LipB [Solirubrobacterales bacterium]HMT04436.1 lipoyl(octanoyl) transferase LipB [Solirubrobacterales bacterium]
MTTLSVISLGRRDYAEMARAQEQLAADRLEGKIGDLLLLLEHPSTYTLGRRSEPSDLLHDTSWYRAQGISICETPRGGKVTWHGPGQLVAYPVIDLRGLGTQPAEAGRVDVAGFVGSLESSMARTLAEWGLVAGRIEGLTGLWIDDERPRPADFEGVSAVDAAPGLARGSIRKIGSIGLRIHRGVSTHGLSINVNCDLEPFNWINSCGIESCRPTSIATELGNDGPSVESVGAAIAAGIGAATGLVPVKCDPGQVGLPEARPENSVA